MGKARLGSGPSRPLAVTPEPIIVEKVVIREVPVERIVTKEIRVPVEVIKEVIKDRPVEVIREIEKIVKVPVEVIRETIVDRPVEVIREVQVEVVREVTKYKVPFYAWALIGLEAFSLIAFIVLN